MKLFKGIAAVGLAGCAAYIFWAAIPGVPNGTSLRGVPGAADSTAEFSRIWSLASSKYLNLGQMSMDVITPLLFCGAGVLIVFGIDYAVRRKADSVIKRFISRSEDKR